MSLVRSSNVTNINKDGLIPRVYNGWPAQLGDVPYQISFKSQPGLFYPFVSFCGGVIIGPSKLLSAAHCFVENAGFCEKLFGRRGKIDSTKLFHIYAVAGQLSNAASRGSRGKGQWRRLEGVWYPPQYSFPKWDFAIVSTMRPFKFNDYVNSIPYASKFIDYNGKCLVSGFGRTSPKTTSDKLLLAHLTLLPWRWCDRMHYMNMAHFICTSSQYTDVGKGDSGGPLVCANTGDPQESSKGVLVGIVSGHAVGVGSFFTRVSSFYKYIENNKSYDWNKTHPHLILLYLIHWRFLLF